MPRLPDITSLGERPQVAPVLSGVTLDPGAASANAKAQRELGATGMEVAVEYQRHLQLQTERVNKLRAEDATNQLLNAEQDLTIGDKGFANVQGGDAVTRPLAKEYTQQFDDRRKQIASTLSTPEQQHIFQQRADIVARQFGGRLVTHISRERDTYEKQVIGGAAAAAVSNAATNFASDDAVDTYLDRYKFIRQERGRNEGEPRDFINADIAKVNDQVWASRLTAEAAQDPVGAYARLQANRDKMSPAAYQTLEAHTFGAADDLMAIRAQSSLPKVRSQVAPMRSPSADETLPALANAIKTIESGGNQAAVSPQGARGSMQIMPATFKQYAKPGESFDNEDHRTAAAMRKIQDDFQFYGGDPIKTAAAYIGGRGAVRSDGTIRADVADSLGTTPAAYAQKVAVLLKTGQAQTQQDAAALTLATMTPAQAVDVKTGDELIDGLPPQRKLAVLQKAHAQARQGQQLLAQQVDGRVRDATAEFLVTGRAANAPTREELVAAHGPVVGEQRYQRLQEVAQTGQNIQMVKTLPNTDLEALRAQRPSLGDGFAERQRNYELLDHAIGQVQQQRQADPVSFALSTKSYGIQPMTSETLKDPNALTAEMKNRARAAGNMAQDYGTKPAMLTKAESQALSGVLKQSPVPAQKQYLAALYNGAGDISVFKSIMNQLAPDQPVVALAGIYQAKQYQSTGQPEGGNVRDVADLILRGNAILNPPSKEDGGKHDGGHSLVKMPKDQELHDGFITYTGDALKDKPQARDLFMQTARAVYAAKAAEDGDYSGNLNSARWKSAMEIATGGIEKHKGASIVLPYGIPIDKFEDGLKERIATVAPHALKATPDELANLPLENAGDGRYVFRRGSGYVVDVSGRPLVVDFNVSTGTPALVTPAIEAGKLEVRPFSVTKGGAVTGVRK